MIKRACVLNVDPERLAADVEEVRLKAIFEEPEAYESPPGVVLTPMAEQHYLLACAALETARAHFKLANSFLMRGD